MRSYHILGNNKLHLPHHYHIYYCNSYGNNSINSIKIPSIWFLLAIFMMLSIIPLYQLLKLYIFIFFINNDVSFINDDISCSYKCSYKLLKKTWLISNEKLMNLDVLSLLFLLPYVFSSFSSTIKSIAIINTAISHSEWLDQSTMKSW